MLRLIGVRIAVAVAGAAIAGAAARERIRVTITAAPGRHRVALFEAGISAAPHSRSDVGPAIVGIARRRRRRRHGDEAKGKHRRGGRNGRLQSCFSFSLSLSVSGVLALVQLVGFWRWFSPAAHMVCRGSLRHRHK